MTIFRTAEEIESSYNKESEAYEIGLFPDELLDVFQEQQHIYDVEDITQEVEFRFGLWNTKEVKDCLKRILDDEELLSKIAFKMRNRMKQYSMGNDAAVQESIDEAINKLKNSEN